MAKEPSVSPAKRPAPANAQRGVSGLEARLDYLATKEDIQKLKVWILGGTLGSGALALSIAAVFIRWWA